jgi:CHASE3 domain sensor protein
MTNKAAWSLILSFLMVLAVFSVMCGFHYVRMNELVQSVEGIEKEVQAMATAIILEGVGSCLKP